MRILHLESGRHLYGGARQVLYLLEGLRALGVDSHLAAPRGSAIAEQASPFVQGLHPILMQGDLDLALTWRLVGLIRRLKPDLVHVHSRRGADIYGGLAARVSGTRAILSRRVDNPEPPWVVAAKYRLYERIIAISEGIRAVLIRGGLRPGKVVCVHSAIRVSDYRVPCNRERGRRELGVPVEAVAAGVIAQLIPRKGHRHLLAALPGVLAQHPEFHIVLFGRGPLRAELEEQVQAAGLAAHVHFAGFREDLPALLGCLDFVVHPADIEGLGVSLLQAAAVGLPLIGTRTGGIPEIVVHGETGLLVEAADVTGLGEAISRMAGDAALRRTLGAGALGHVTRHFDLPSMVRGNLAVYREVLGHPVVSTG